MLFAIGITMKDKAMNTEASAIPRPLSSTFLCLSLSNTLIFLQSYWWYMIDMLRWADAIRLLRWCICASLSDISDWEHTSTKLLLFISFDLHFQERLSGLISKVRSDIGYYRTFRFRCYFRYFIISSLFAILRRRLTHIDYFTQRKKPNMSFSACLYHVSQLSLYAMLFATHFSSPLITAIPAACHATADYFLFKNASAWPLSIMV